MNDDRRFLRDTVRDMAKGLDPVTAWPTLRDAGFGDLGATPLPDVAVVVEALGELLCPSPFLGSAVLGATLLHVAGIEGIDGASTVVLDNDLLALAPSGVAWDCVDGTTPLAVDGTTVLAATPGAPVDNAFDLRRPCRRAAGGEPIGTLDHAAHERWLAVALVALAAEQCGVMAAALDRAVAYARDRVQFGRPIGSFQAVQHLAADAYVRLEATRSAVYAAADDGRLTMARMAKITANDNARRVVETSLQIHGGIGMTWEFPGHHELRRAWLDTVTLGDTRHHLRLLKEGR